MRIFAGDCECTVCDGNTDDIHSLCISPTVVAVLQVTVLYVSVGDSAGRNGGLPPGQGPIPPTVSCQWNDHIPGCYVICIVLSGICSEVHVGGRAITSYAHSTSGLVEC